MRVIKKNKINIYISYIQVLQNWSKPPSSGHIKLNWCKIKSICYFGSGFGPNRSKRMEPPSSAWFKPIPSTLMNINWQGLLACMLSFLLRMWREGQKGEENQWQRNFEVWAPIMTKIKYNPTPFHSSLYVSFLLMPKIGQKWSYKEK